RAHELERAADLHRSRGRHRRVWRARPRARSDSGGAASGASQVVRRVVVVRRSVKGGITMTGKTFWDTVSAEGEAVMDKLKALIHEGNVRRVVIRQEGRTVAEFPLTAGVVGAVLAPVLAAIGALVAVMQNCSIEVEREQGSESAAKDEKRVS